ncbi:unnamed protein product [Brassica oleracea]|uniref:(rape) hypothetical protein n=1 Tax=Brassica napus TaxID=3708 RepID=A0A816QGC8_BRANA|nr:unnamed protein product [Brassica napus]
MKMILTSETMDIPDGIAMKVHAKLIKTPSPGRDSSRSTRGSADWLSQSQFFNLNCFEQC